MFRDIKRKTLILRYVGYMGDGWDWKTGLNTSKKEAHWFKDKEGNTYEVSIRPGKIVYSFKENDWYNVSAKVIDLYNSGACIGKYKLYRPKINHI